MAILCLSCKQTSILISPSQYKRTLSKGLIATHFMIDRFPIKCASHCYWAGERFTAPLLVDGFPMPVKYWFTIGFPSAYWRGAPPPYWVISDINGNYWSIGDLGVAVLVHWICRCRLILAPIGSQALTTIGSEIHSLIMPQVLFLWWWFRCHSLNTCYRNNLYNNVAARS